MSDPELRRRIPLGPIGVLVGAVALGAFILVANLRSGQDLPDAPGSVTTGKPVVVEETPIGPVAPEKPAEKKARNWPPKEIVLGPPGGSVPHAKAPVIVEADKAPVDAKPRKVRKSPVSPPKTPDFETVASWDIEDPETVKNVSRLMKSDRVAPSLKLAAMAKLREAPADRAVPVLVDVLDGDVADDDVVTKPTAVKTLVDLNHPAAREALGRLARTSNDERVRVAIATFMRVKGDSK